MITMQIKKSEYKLWLILPLMFFITLTINLWLWRTIQENNIEIGVASRIIGPLASISMIPLSKTIEKLSFGLITTLGVAIFFLGLIFGLLTTNIYTINCSIFLLSLASYLIMFRSQLEFSLRQEGAHELRNQIMWYGFLCMLAATIPGYISEYFTINKSWLILIVISAICSIPLLIDIIKTKPIKNNIQVTEYKIERLKSWFTLFKNPQIKLLSQQTIILSGTMSLFNIVIPLWVINNNWENGHAGFIIGISGIASLLIRFIFKHIKWGEKPARDTVNMSCLAISLIFVVWPWISNFELGIVISIVYGLIYGISAPLSTSLYIWTSNKLKNSGGVFSTKTAVSSLIALSNPALLGIGVKLGMFNLIWSIFGVSSVCISYKQFNKTTNRLLRKINKLNQIQ